MRSATTTWVSHPMPQERLVGTLRAPAGFTSNTSICTAGAVKNMGHTARGWLHSTGNEGVIKLVADRDSGVLVGATSVGPHGGEVLGMLSLAVHAAVPIRTIRSTIFAYPTFHKGIEDALNELEL